jgi:hypothetical protein
MAKLFVVYKVKLLFFISIHVVLYIRHTIKVFLSKKLGGGCYTRCLIYGTILKA